MPEIAIRLYGVTPSFDPKDGPLTAQVEVEGGTSAYEVDRERGRCWLRELPAFDGDRWQSARGVLSLARRGWWGLSVRMDRLPQPHDFAPLEIEPDQEFRRPFLPRDMASCPNCGSLVILERGKKDESRFQIVTPTRRLANRVEQVIRGAGFFAFVTNFKGRGRVASVKHSTYCYVLPLFQAFTERPRRRGVGRPRKEKTERIPMRRRTKRAET